MNLKYWGLGHIYAGKEEKSLGRLFPRPETNMGLQKVKQKISRVIREFEQALGIVQDLTTIVETGLGWVPNP